MSKRICFSVFFLLSVLLIQAQVPNNLVKIVEDSPLKKVLITDLNNDDIKEIMVLRENDDIIVYYLINGVYIRDIYVDVEQPLFMGYDDLNRDGGPDLYYTAASFDGVNMIYGETGSPYELNTAQFGDDLNGVEDGTFFEYESGNFSSAGVALVTGDGNMHIYSTFASSFFYLGAQLVSTIPISGVPGQITFAGATDFGTLSLTNVEENRIENYTLEGGQFSLTVTDTQYVESYSSPYGIAGDRKDDGKIELYITDKSSNSFISSPAVDPVIIDEDLEDPGKVYIFDVDGDGEREAYVEDGRKVYRYDDLAFRSARELFFEADQPIKDMVIGDIDGDELVDVIFIQEGSNEISILTHEVVGVENHKSVNVQVYPNPSSNYLNIQSDILPSQVKVTDMQGLVNTIKIDQKRIDISSLSSGRYLLSYDLDGVTYSTSFIKSHN